VNNDTAAEGTLDLFGKADFIRDDESPDPNFCIKARFISHLDSLTLPTVEDLFVGLIPKGFVIPDLIAGPDSHLRPEIQPDAVTWKDISRARPSHDQETTDIIPSAFPATAFRRSGHG